jgi:zinc protease
MFKKYQLKNGLKVLLVESHKSPVLSIQMWVKTGSADEKKGEEGISHFIEHLVFKGSRKFKVGEIASTVEGAGGELNAYTSFDQTVFYVTISKEFENVGLDVIAEMMGFPTFDAKEIDNERGVVIEEIKRSNDSPHRQASRLLFTTMYRKHAYGIPVIGYESNINTVTRETLLDYFHSRYNPKTMTLIVAGDFQSKDMKPKIQKFFGTFPSNKLRAVKRIKDVQQKKTNLVVKTAPFNETIVHLAFPTPKAEHQDIAALEVFALIFGQGDSSRLNQRLRMDAHLVNFAGCSVFVARDPGFFAVSLSLNDKDFTQAMQALLEELESALTIPPEKQDLDKALTNIASEQFYYLETVDGLARKYGHYQDLFGDPSYFSRFMQQVHSLTAQDVLKVARKYINPKLASLIIMTPAEAAVIKPQATAWLKDLRRRVPGKIAKNSKPTKGKKVSWAFKKPASVSEGVERWPLKNGATLITRPNFDTPVLSLRAASLGGSRLETAATQGATELLSRVWTAGAGAFDEQQMNQRMDEMAASLSAFAGRNSQGLSMSCLKPYLPDMLDMFFSTLNEPHFESTAIRREIKAMQEQVKLRKDNPGQLCILAFMKSMFGDHPYGRDPYGDAEGIARLSQASVREIFNQGSGMTLVASGAFEPKVLKQQVEEAFGLRKFTAGRSLTFPLQYPKKDQRMFQHSVKEQSHIVVGYPGLNLNDPQRYTLQVIQAILAGQGGRLFLELRDKASLAYTVSPMRMEGIEGGYFGAYIGCSPEKAAKAISMMHEEFSKLQETLVGADELARAQRYLIGKHDIELQKNGNITSAILFDEIYGIDYMDTYKFAEHVRSVKSEDLRALAQKIFSQAAVTSLVGPHAPWQEKQDPSKMASPA